ncbi:MAG: hypothetical protein ACRDK0_14920, partial [Solirubrobacteraceae bacterium]
GQAELARIESAVGRARNFSVNGTATTFDIAADSVAGANGGGRFTSAKQAGVVVRGCANAGQGACPTSGFW